MAKPGIDPRTFFILPNRFPSSKDRFPAGHRALSGLFQSRRKGLGRINYFSLGRCKIDKFRFHQTFITNLHLLRVEFRCKFPGKLHRVTEPLAHDVVLSHTFELLINTTMLFWYI